MGLAQERINEFVVNLDETHNHMTIYSSYGATPNDGVVIVNSSIPDLEFNIPAAPGRIRTIPDKKKNRYVLIIQPNDNVYRQYTITINATGFRQGKIEGVVVKAGLSSGYIIDQKNVDFLYANEWSIYRNGRAMGEYDIRELFANTESYNLYKEGIDKKNGAGFVEIMLGTLGVISLGSGTLVGCIGLFADDDDISDSGLWLIGGGAVTLISCLVARQSRLAIGKNNIKKAVDLYNNQRLLSQNTIEMKCGLTGNGICFTLLF